MQQENEGAGYPAPSTLQSPGASISAFTNTEHLGATLRADTLRRWLAVLHGYGLDVFHFPLDTTFGTELYFLVEVQEGAYLILLYGIDYLPCKNGDWPDGSLLREVRCQKANDNINLSVREGEVFGLLGPNDG